MAVLTPPELQVLFMDNYPLCWPAGDPCPEDGGWVKCKKSVENKSLNRLVKPAYPEGSAVGRWPLGALPLYFIGSLLPLGTTGCWLACRTQLSLPLLMQEVTESRSLPFFTAEQLTGPPSVVPVVFGCTAKSRWRPAVCTDSVAEQWDLYWIMKFVT